jgi:mono/diheme cytochrome c family protein
MCKYVPEHRFFVKIISSAALAGLFSFHALTTPVIAQERVPSVRDGVYNEEQAIRGQVLYYQHCLACHGEMMNGQDQAPPLAGPQFSGVWDGEPLLALVDRILTMPPEKPGSLSQAESVDLLTYILWYNGLPLGSQPLAADNTLLARMPFETPPPGQ